LRALSWFKALSEISLKAGRSQLLIMTIKVVMLGKADLFAIES